MTKEIINNDVELYRRKMNLTQEELATRVGVSRQTIIALEKGNYIPSILLALKLSKCFNVSPEKIFKIQYEK